MFFFYSKSSCKLKSSYRNDSINTEFAADVVGSTVAAAAVVRSAISTMSRIFTLIYVL